MSEFFLFFLHNANSEHERVQLMPLKPLDQSPCSALYFKGGSTQLCKSTLLISLSVILVGFGGQDIICIYKNAPHAIQLATFHLQRKKLKFSARWEYTSRGLCFFTTQNPKNLLFVFTLFLRPAPHCTRTEPSMLSSYSLSSLWVYKAGASLHITINFYDSLFKRNIIVSISYYFIV